MKGLQLYAKKSFEKTTCVTKIIYHIFMQKCSKICKNLFHNAKRTKVCTFHDLNISTSLSHKIKHSIQKEHILKQVHVPSIEKISTFCVVMWMNTNLVCKMFLLLVFFPIDFDMEWQQWKPAAETTQPRKRDLSLFSFCCQWKWLSGHNWWAEIKCLQMDEC